MTGIAAFTVLVALVALERLAELVVSRRNAAWSLARGAVEHGRGHYPVMVLLHCGFLVAMLVEAWVRRPEVPPALAWSMLGLVVPSQALRWWCIATLGPRWNTRVLVVPGLAPVDAGPYRLLRHPNYVAVVVEGVALPMVHLRGSPPWGSPWPTPCCCAPGSGSRTPRWPSCHEAGSMRDLLVAGGGPVGLATALEAWHAGLDVCVVEPRDGAIDKACGEGLMPGAVDALTGLGVALDDGHPITGIRYLDGSRAVEAPFTRGPGLGVRRTALHRAMSDAVTAAGVPAARRAVRTIEDRGDHLLVDGEPTRHLVAADGLHSPVRRLVGLDRPASGPRRYGQRFHVEVEPWTSMVEVHWSPLGEAYVTPVGPGLVGVAVLSAGPGPAP